MHRPFNSLLGRLLLGSAFPVVLFIGVALVAAAVTVRLFDSWRWEDHSRDVIRLALLQRQQLDQMRLSVRLLPLRRPARLDADYERSRAEYRRIDAQLHELARDNKPQLALLQEMTGLVDHWHAVVEEHLERLQPRTGEEPVDAEQEAQRFHDESAPIMDRLQEAGRAFMNEEERLLHQRREQTARDTWQGFLVLGLSLAVAVILTAVAAYASARGVVRPLAELSRASSELMAGRLQLAPVAGPNEIARLIVRFNHMAITLSERTSLLKREEERYRTYVLASAHILWTADAGGEVVAELPAWQSYTGQSAEAVRGLGWLDAVHPDDRPGVVERWKECVADGAPFEAEFRLRGASGEYRDFYCRGVPILDRDDGVREWIGTCTDVTERKREAALRRAKEAAESSSRAKTEFLTKMSHELRTPLNAVIGMSRMLLTQRFGPLNEKQIDYLSDITHSGEHLLALINDILDLSKVEAGKMDVRPEPFALVEAVAAVLSPLRPLAEAKGVALEFPPPADGTLTTDPGRFRQVLFNLLSNAIKFTPGPGRVSVRCEWVDRADPSGLAVTEPGAKAVRVEVRDTGVGIAAEDQPKVWEEFRQLKTGATQEGTGLGLALTRRLVRLLGGSIWLRSAPGQGSTFAFVLPREAPTSHEPRATSHEPDGRPLVLVVEDHPPTHKLLIDWLVEAGLSAASAYDGEAALEMARRLRPRLILLDLHLPRRDGWEVLTELRGDPDTASLPVVVLSVSEDREAAAALGVKDFLIKPVDRDELLARLRAVRPDLWPRELAPAAPT